MEVNIDACFHEVVFLSVVLYADSGLPLWKADIKEGPGSSVHPKNAAVDWSWYIF